MPCRSEAPQHLRPALALVFLAACASPALQASDRAESAAWRRTLERITSAVVAI